MISGSLMAILGAIGTLGMYYYISNDVQYTYTGHLTAHESSMLGALVFCILLLLVGVLTAIYSFIKKSNRDTLTRIENLGANGKPTGTCPICGLNLANGALICPKCGHKLKEEER